jgi:hypothetical protein
MGRIQADKTGLMNDLPTRRGTAMDDQLDVPLEDAELLAEVELTTNLIIAASATDKPLSQDDIDRLLGLPEGAHFPTQQVRDITRD